jgi:opacity protein-like surface antigen
MKRLTILAMTLLTLCLARDAAAQIFINPFIGTTLSSPSPSGDSSKPGYGVALGSVGTIIGFETEFAYFPELLDNSANNIAKNHVFTISGNVLVGPTIGPVKVYAAGGIGGLTLDVTSVSTAAVPNPTSVSDTYFSFNVGGGVIGFFSDHWGVRGDVRYFRALGFKIGNENVALDQFDFWRANIGLAIKF